jgi:FMN-dependent NADH-azoreductase
VLGGADEAAAAESAATMEQFLAADVIVIGAPMYNFGIPSTLKAWIDRVAVGRQDLPLHREGPEGLATGKKLIVASGRGGIYGDSSPADFQEAYLRHTLGFWVSRMSSSSARRRCVFAAASHRCDGGAHASIVRAGRRSGVSDQPMVSAPPM